MIIFYSDFKKTMRKFLFIKDVMHPGLNKISYTSFQELIESLEELIEEKDDPKLSFLESKIIKLIVVPLEYHFCQLKSGGVRNGKFLILTPLKKNPPKSMKPPRPTQRKFVFKLCYSTITKKNKET